MDEDTLFKLSGKLDFPKSRKEQLMEELDCTETDAEHLVKREQKQKEEKFAGNIIKVKEKVKYEDEMSKIKSLEQQNPNSGTLKIDGVEHGFFGFAFPTEDGKKQYLVLDDGTLLKGNDSEFTINDQKLQLTEMGLTENQITPSGLLKVREHFEKNKKIDSIQLYEKVKKKLQDYIDFKANEEYDLVACWIFHCYFINKFGTTTYLQLLSRKAGTGKSQTIKTVMQMTPKSSYTFNPTVATIYRGLERNQSTLGLDEIDKWNEETKREIIGILNNGIYTGGHVERCSKETNEIERFPVFSPKIFAGNKQTQEASFKSRTVDIWMIKTKRKVKDIDQPNEKEKQEFQEIRDMLYLWALQNWKDVVETYTNRPVEVSSRQEQVLKPLYPIIKIMGKEKELLEYLRRELQDKEEEEVEADRYYYLLKALYELFDELKIVPVKEITERWCSELLNAGWSEQYLPTSRSCGKALRTELKLSKYKRRDGRGTNYELSPEIIKERILDFNYTTILQEDTVSNSTQTTQITQTTQHSDFDDVKNSESVVSAVNGVCAVSSKPKSPRIEDVTPKEVD